MASSESDEPQSSPLPSGSRWGPKQVARVGFADRPDEHEFSDFVCELEDSSDINEVLGRLSKIFAVSEEDIGNEEATQGFEKHSYFYTNLAELLEAPRSPDPPRRAVTRNTKQWSESGDSESVFPSSPPISENQPPTRESTPSTVGPLSKKPRFYSPTTPTPPRSEPKLPTRDNVHQVSPSPANPRSNQSGHTAAEDCERRRSISQLIIPQSTPLNSDSTYYPQSGPSAVSSELSPQPEQNNSLEILVNDMMKSFLRIICDEHGERRGIKFHVIPGPIMNLPVSGNFSTAKPDWTIQMRWVGGKINILDYEVWGNPLISAV